MEVIMMIMVMRMMMMMMMKTMMMTAASISNRVTVRAPIPRPGLIAEPKHSKLSFTTMTKSTTHADRCTSMGPYPKRKPALWLGQVPLSHIALVQPLRQQSQKPWLADALFSPTVNLVRKQQKRLCDL